MNTEKEVNNIFQVKKLFSDIMEAINESDINRLREIKGELKAMQGIVSPLEMAMGFSIGAIAQYREKTKAYQQVAEEDDKTSKSRK